MYLLKVFTSNSLGKTSKRQDFPVNLVSFFNALNYPQYVNLINHASMRNMLLIKGLVRSLQHSPLSLWSDTAETVKN